MPHSIDRLSVTSEFGHELELQRRQWLRRRFQWYCGVMIALGLLMHIVGIMSGEQSTTIKAIWWITLVVSTAAYGAALAYVAHRGPRARIPTLTIASWLIVGLGVMSLAVAPIVSIEAQRSAIEWPEPSAERETRAEPVSEGLPSVPLDSPRARVPSAEPTVSNLFKLSIPRDAGPEEARELAIAQARAQVPGYEGLSPLIRGAVEASIAAAADRAAESARQRLTEQDFRENARRGGTLILGAFAALWSIFVAHFVACCFLPWTGAESMRPMWPLLGFNAAIAGWLAFDANAKGMPLWIAGLSLLGIVLFSLLTPLPGLAVCWWRHSRFRQRTTFDLLRGRYSQLKQELISARQIHEALFPTQIRAGAVRFVYAYEPNRQIGGDYLFAHAGADLSRRAQPDINAPLSVVLIDVTGHGIPAALTVNRVHGELSRIFAEQPSIHPGELLTLLNRYVFLTMSSHSVYATAICFRLDHQQGRLEYASGGHPPAFIRTVDGRLEQLDSTSFVLGAVPPDDFHPEPRTLRFGLGDVLIAYTDGLTEARDQHGRMFGVEGIRRVLINPTPDAEGSMLPAINRAVLAHRFGPTEDDILIIEVRCPFAPAPVPQANPDTAQAQRIARSRA